MFTHQDIWNGIDRLAQAQGYSASGLAKQAGLDPTSFNKSKRVSPDGKPRWPSTESLSKVLAVTGATMDDFLNLIDPVKAAALPANNEKFDAKAAATKTAEILLSTQTAAFNAKEPFLYSSGNKGPVYVDVRRLMSFPAERNLLMDMGAALVRAEIGLKNIDYIAGGETAGIPFAAFLAERLNKPMLYVRKKPKGHGKMAQIEGAIDPAHKSPRILLVEDLQNYGANKKVFIDAIREAGARVEHFFVLFDYGIRPEVKAENKAMDLKGHSLCSWAAVLKTAKADKAFDAKTLKSVESFLKAPEDWKAVS